MIRVLLLLFLGLSAALPPGVCPCLFAHAHDAEHADEHDEETPAPADRDCPCECQVSIQDATIPPRLQVEPGHAFEIPLPPPAGIPVLTFTHPSPNGGRPASPPRGFPPSLPLYLAVARLLI